MEICAESVGTDKKHSLDKIYCYIAFTVLAISGLIFVKTLNPQMHFISGSLSSSVFDACVPQRRHL